MIGVPEFLFHLTTLQTTVICLLKMNAGQVIFFRAAGISYLYFRVDFEKTLKILHQTYFRFKSRIFAVLVNYKFSHKSTFLHNFAFGFKVTRFQS